MNPSLRPLILASSSPRRQDLLRELGEPFTILVPDVDETLPPGPVTAAVRAVALAKARAVAARLAAGTVLAADTVVEVAGEVLGKPADAAAAHAMLRRLSGSRHQVHTGVALRHVPSGREATATATTTLTMRTIEEAEREAYVVSGEPFGKAGAYAVQETGDRFVVGMEGPYDNVVGLPLGTVRRLLAELERGLDP